MTFKSHTSCIRTIRQGDDNFLVQDGMVLSPRAGFEISSECPNEYKMIISRCIDRGWLQPVAYMKDSELTWEILQQ